MDFLQLFPVSPHHSTSTEPGLVFQVPVKRILPVSCAASTDPHCSKIAEFSHQALALLWVVTETFGPSSCIAVRQVWLRTQQVALSFMFSQCCCGVSTSSSSSPPCSGWCSRSSRSGSELASLCGSSALSPLEFMALRTT